MKGKNQYKNHLHYVFVGAQESYRSSEKVLSIFHHDDPYDFVMDDCLYVKGDNVIARECVNIGGLWDNKENSVIQDILTKFWPMVEKVTADRGPYPVFITFITKREPVMDVSEEVIKSLFMKNILLFPIVQKDVAPRWRELRDKFSYVSDKILMTEVDDIDNIDFSKNLQFREWQTSFNLADTRLASLYEKFPTDRPIDFVFLFDRSQKYLPPFGDLVKDIVGAASNVDVISSTARFAIVFSGDKKNGCGKVVFPFSKPNELTYTTVTPFFNESVEADFDLASALDMVKDLSWRENSYRGLAIFSRKPPVEGESGDFKCKDSKYSSYEKSAKALADMGVSVLQMTDSNDTAIYMKYPGDYLTIDPHESTESTSREWATMYFILRLPLVSKPKKDDGLLQIVFEESIAVD